SWPRAEMLLARAFALAEELGHPHAIGLANMVNGMAANLQGHWKHALISLECARAIFEDNCTGVAWETATSEHMGIWALAYLGEIAELTDRVFVYRDNAKRRSDRYAFALMSTGLASFAQL